MTAAVDSRAFNGLGTGATRNTVSLGWDGPIADNKNIPSGTLVGALLTDTNSSPVLYPYLADATMRCLGFARVGFDNTVSGHVAAARPLSVCAQSGLLVDLNSNIANTDIYKPAYGVDNQTCSKTSSDGPCIGIILGIDPASGLTNVLVDPVIAAFMTATVPGDGTVTAAKMAAAAIVLSGATVTGVLPLANGGTGSATAPDFHTLTGAMQTATSATNLFKFNQRMSFGTATNTIADPGSAAAIPVLSNATCAITIGSAGAETNTVAAPTYMGQRLTICVDTCGSGTRVVTLTGNTTILDGTNNTITYSAVGQKTTMEAITVGAALKWSLIVNTGAALSHV